MDFSSLLSLLQGNANQNPLLSLLPLLFNGNGQGESAQNQKGKDMLLPLLSSLLSNGGPNLADLFTQTSSPPQQAKRLPSAPLDPISQIADHEILYSLSAYLSENHHFSE